MSRFLPREDLLPPISVGRRHVCGGQGDGGQAGRTHQPGRGRGLLHLLHLQSGLWRPACAPPRSRGTTERAWVRAGRAESGIAARQAASREVAEQSSLDSSSSSSVHQRASSRVAMKTDGNGRKKPHFYFCFYIFLTGIWDWVRKMRV